MAVRQYIGARYVPKFADPVEWDNTSIYEPLIMVTYNGSTYISRTHVPVGVDISNTDYWILFSVFSAQVEQYRQEVEQYSGRISAVEGKFPVVSADIADDAVTSGKIAAGAVETADIADGAVTGSKIAAGAVDTTNIADDAITSGKIAAGAVETADIADDAITSGKIASGAVEDDAIAPELMQEILFKTNSTDGTIFYVGVSGSDDNDGLTVNTPFKTLDKALSMVNQGYTYILIYFIEAGTYISTYRYMSNLSVHISAQVDNVNVRFQNQFRFYNGYMSCTSSATGNLKVFFDDGVHGDDITLYAYKTDFIITTRCDFTGTDIQFDSSVTVSTPVRISLTACTVNTQDLGIVLTADAANVVFALASFISVSGILSVTVPNTFTNAYFRIERCFLAYTSSSIVLSNLANITYALVLRSSFNAVHNDVFTYITQAKFNSNYSLVKANNATTFITS